MHFFQFIHPNNNMKTIWDMMHFFLILILFFLIPLDFAFEINFELEFKFFIILFFILDIVITLHTAYYQKGILMKKRYQIMINYLKTDGFSDILTLIFYVVELPHHSFVAILQLVFFLRWSKLNSINLKLAEKFKIEDFMNHAIIALLYLFLFCLYFMHVFACVWIYLGFLYAEEGSTWIIKSGLSDSSMLYQYLYALYWSAVTLMTVGYGDISAQNIHEIWFSTLAIIIGCGVLAYIINSIGIIVNDMNKDIINFK